MTQGVFCHTFLDQQKQWEITCRPRSIPPWTLIWAEKHSVPVIFLNCLRGRCRLCTMYSKMISLSEITSTPKITLIWQGLLIQKLNPEFSQLQVRTELISTQDAISSPTYYVCTFATWTHTHECEACEANMRLATIKREKVTATIKTWKKQRGIPRQSLRYCKKGPVWKMKTIEKNFALGRSKQTLHTLKARIVVYARLAIF